MNITSAQYVTILTYQMKRMQKAVIDEVENVCSYRS